MKVKIHAVAGVAGFSLILAFVTATVFSALFGSVEAMAAVKQTIFRGVFVVILALLAAGASGVSLLGKRTELMALTKQKRGPIAFMTSLLVLLPSSYFLSRWASANSFDEWYYGVQTLELVASGLCVAMIGLNIRDGLALTGRFGLGGTTNSSIVERDGGPLIATAIPSLTSSGSQALENRPVMALCRCGASKNKPYCDRSHNEIGFDSNPSEDRTKDEVLVYEGEEITVHYNRLLCSHAAECGKRQKAAFDSSRKPWIIPDNASKEGVMEVIKACPSGALRFSVSGENPQQDQPDSNGVTVEKNGPYRVVGVPLAEPRLAEGAHAEKYVLCRCGASKNKPYCDGSHFDIKWNDSNG